MTEIKLTKRYPQSRTEDTVDAFMRGYEKGRADRPQGRNLSEEYPSLFECSVCGASCFDTFPWDCDINYCPNCGAKMKGADDE